MKMTFCLKGGQHVDDKGKSYKKGDLITSSLRLDKIFINKFEQIHEDDQPDDMPKKPDIPTATPLKKGSAAETDSKAEPFLEYGEDVTETIKEAVAANLKVFCKKGWYTVLDPEDTALLSDKKMREDDMIKLVKQYVVK